MKTIWKKTMIAAAWMFVFLFGNGLSVPAQEVQKNETARPRSGRYSVLSVDKKIRIPFEIFRNKFRFKARVNGKECFLLLDNGSLWDEVLFFGSPVVDALGLKFSGETSLGPNKADTAENVRVEFDDVVFDGLSAVITRYDPRLPNLWAGTEGQLSATFFKNFVVRIDFAASAIELIAPENFRYAGAGQELAMKPGPFNSRLVSADIQLSDGKTIGLDLLIDLGGIYPLYLPLGKYEQITVPGTATEITLGAGLRVQKGFLGQVAGVQLGKLFLKDVQAAFIPVSQDAGVYGNTMIGLPLLRNFNVIFDYFNERMILESAGMVAGSPAAVTLLPEPGKKK
jgi:hypothetical protein